MEYYSSKQWQQVSVFQGYHYLIHSSDTLSPDGTVILHPTSFRSTTHTVFRHYVCELEGCSFAQTSKINELVHHLLLNPHHRLTCDPNLASATAHKFLNQRKL